MQSQFGPDSRYQRLSSTGSIQDSETVWSYSAQCHAAHRRAGQSVRNRGPAGTSSQGTSCSAGKLCGEGMKVMRHCRQCRADAIGLLGQDRSADFTWDNIEQAPPLNNEAREQFQASLDEKIRQRMFRTKNKDVSTMQDNQSIRVAVASRGAGKINLHFGHAQEFMIYESDGNAVKFLGIRKVQAYCHGRADCNGDKEETLREICSILKDCGILLCSGIGDSPRKLLHRSGVLPLVRKGDIETLILESVKYNNYFQNTTISKG